MWRVLVLAFSRRRAHEKRGFKNDYLYTLLLPALGAIGITAYRFGGGNGIHLVELSRLRMQSIAGGLIAGIGRAVLVRVVAERIRTIEVVRFSVASAFGVGVWFS